MKKTCPICGYAEMKKEWIEENNAHRYTCMNCCYVYEEPKKQKPNKTN